MVRTAIPDVPLVGHRFFTPTEKFWSVVMDTPWIRYRQIVDVGAGLGHVARGLVDRGLDPVAIDVAERRGQDELVELVDVVDFEFRSHHLALLARPCHGLFVEQVLTRAAVHQNTDALYVGLPRNLAADLHGWVTEELATDVGEEGEKLLRVVCREDEAETYYSYTRLGETGTRFARKGPDPTSRGSDDEYWLNDFGAGYPVEGTETLLGSHRARDSYQIRLPAEEVCRGEDCVNGWLAPDGVWFRGFSAEHAYIASVVLGMSEADLERRGFARCYGQEAGAKRADFWTMSDKKDLTPAQSRELRRAGFTVHDFEETRSVATPERGVF